MSGKLVRHGGVYVVTRVVALGTPFLLLPVYARLLGDAGLGTVELLTSVAAFLTPLLVQGLVPAWVRLRFDYETERERAVLDSTITWYLLLSGAVALLLLALIGPLVAEWVIPGIPFYPLGMLTTAAAVAALFSALCERKLQTEQKVLGYAAFSLLRASLSVGVIALFVVGLRRGVLGKVEADLVWCGLLAVVSLLIIRPGSPRRMSKSVLRRSLSFGLPLVPHTLAALSGGVIGRLLLNGMLGVAAVGVYSMGFRLAWGANVIATALNQAYQPIYIQAITAAETEQVERAEQLRAGLARSALVSVVLVSCTALGITAYGRELIAVIATPAFDESWRVLAILNAATVAYAYYLPFSQALMQSNRGTRVLPFLTVASAVLNIVGTLVLVPLFGIVGAAWATFAGSGLLALGAFVLGQRLVRLPLDRRRWSLSLVVAGLCLAALAGIDSLSAVSTPWRLLFKTALLLVGVAALLTLGGALTKARRLLRPAAR